MSRLEKVAHILMLLPLQGALIYRYHSQGDALGYVLAGLSALLYFIYAFNGRTK